MSDTPAALLRQRIDESGLSIRDFARRVVMRDEATVHRWLSGESPVPKAVRAMLVNPTPAPWPDTPHTNQENDR